VRDDNSEREPRAGGEPALLGALVGWHSFLTPHGVALRLETATSLAGARQGELGVSDLTLSVAQMRALAHNLVQLADQREGVSRPKRRGWLW